MKLPSPSETQPYIRKLIVHFFWVEALFSPAIHTGICIIYERKLLFEQDQNWDTALRNFKSARAVYEELGKYGDLENQLFSFYAGSVSKSWNQVLGTAYIKLSSQTYKLQNFYRLGEIEGPALDLFRPELVESFKKEFYKEERHSPNEVQF